MDFKSAFHQLELAPESRHNTVFNDSEKLKLYARLTMGTKPASDELKKAFAMGLEYIDQQLVVCEDSDFRFSYNILVIVTEGKVNGEGFKV